jgi:hypothetical protein
MPQFTQRFQRQLERGHVGGGEPVPPGATVVEMCEGLTLAQLRSLPAVPLLGVAGAIDAIGYYDLHLRVAHDHTLIN